MNDVSGRKNKPKFVSGGNWSLPCQSKANLRCLNCSPIKSSHTSDKCMALFKALVYAYRIGPPPPHRQRTLNAHTLLVGNREGLNHMFIEDSASYSLAKFRGKLLGVLSNEVSWRLVGNRVCVGITQSTMSPMLPSLFLVNGTSKYRPLGSEPPPP